MMIFQSKAYKQVGGFKPFLTFLKLGAGSFLEHYGFVIDNAWCNELIAYSCA
jgi:hypothetical protein